MPLSQAANRRRQIIIDPELQKRMVFAAGWPPCLGMAAAIVLLGVFCSRLSSEALDAGVELPSLLWVFLATAAFIVVAMAFVLWTALRISHRVAGPGYNIGRVLERVRAGDLGARVHLRKGDYLGAVADHVNAHLEWLQQHPPAVPGGADHVEESRSTPAADAAARAPADAVSS